MTIVPAGTVLEVLGMQGEWYHVRFPFDRNRIGYVLARLVEPSELGPQSTSELSPLSTPGPPQPASPTATAVATPAPATDTLVIPHVTKRPVITDVWAGNIPESAAVRNFRQYQPGDGSPASLETTAFVWYDNDNFYAFFDCVDEPSHVRARMTKREGIGDDDQVMLLLDTFQDRRRAYYFAVNPLGIQRDGILTEGQGTDYSYDTVWRSEARMTDRGFNVFITIPFKNLRFSNAVDQTWGIALGRYIPANSESSYWPYLTSRVNGFASQFASLRGLNRLSAGHNLQLVPYGAFTGSRYLDTTAPAFVRANEGRVGLDSKLVLRDALTLDVTANPDFSQVESDDPQVTVNKRFEVFFPEKRPFFIENAGLFETPEQLVFSRRIVDPSIGIRLTGKMGRWAVGVLGTDDRAQGARYAETSPYSGRRATAAVVRVQREIGRESSVGLLVTDRQFAASDNRTGAADIRLKLGSNVVFTGQVIRSEDRELDGTSSQGSAANASVAWSGRHFTYSSSFRQRSPDFEAALGFIKRVDIRETGHFASYYWRPEKGALMAFGPTGYASIDWDYSGKRTDWFVQPQLDFYFRRQYGVSVGHAQSYEFFNGIDFNESTTFVTAYTAHSRHWSANVGLTFGTSPNYSPPPGVPPSLGDAGSLATGLTLRPAQWLRIGNTYYYSHLATRPGAGAARKPSEAVFTNHISRTAVNVQFTRALSFRALIDYNTLEPTPSLIQQEVSKGLSGDVLATYLVNPFTAIYAGYTRNYRNLDIADRSGRPTLLLLPKPSTLNSSQVFVKISYRFGL